ncbi:ABC transporter substrate-binding protein [Acidisphaera sp. L21]|uniref:ABC transporter substrate-binding protein n=1 Tax=Acidisphaera sp. L21 TaxID=1641851 RepID=UPI00131E3C0D|nr:ABC transporter substrate-binding protein [Acidisphaera sp. L21]
MKTTAAWLAMALLAAASPAWADVPGNTLKIGVLNDQSGPFADQSGKGSVVAAQLAADDFAKESGGIKVEILYGDHQNKPDVGSTITRRWVDQDGVAAVADAVNSGVALAVNQVLHDKNRTFIGSSVGTSDLTGKFCQPTTVQWTMDTWALGNAAARALTQAGAKKWYFISFDYALGAALEKDTTDALKKLGGSTVVGSVKHPLGTTDFSSYLLQAQSFGADVVAFGDTGSDLVNAVKQAAEFGVTPAQKVTGLFTQITDVKAMGLQLAQGLLLTEAFYWDRDDATRAFTKRFAEKMPGRVPTSNQAGVYSSVLAYLHAAKQADSIEGDKVMAAMKSHPIDDALFGQVAVRADGRAIHPMYVYRVKIPAASKSDWDLYEPVLTIPAEQAFRPLADGGCPLVK